MKALQISASMALALLLGVVVPTVNVSEALAVGNYVNVTKTELDSAITRAEKALTLDLSSTTEHDAGRVYLQKLVDQAKIYTADFNANLDKNLGELEAALSEGAAILTIWAKQDKKTTNTVALTANTEAEQVAYVLPRAAVETRQATSEPVQVAGVISEENRKKLEGSTGNYSAEDLQKLSEGKADAEKLDGENSETIDVPQTGEVTDGAKPAKAGVGLIVAGVVLLAGAGAMLFVRQMKRR